MACLASSSAASRSSAWTACRPLMLPASATPPAVSGPSRCLSRRNAVAKHRHEIGLRHRARDEEALAHVASHAVNGLQVGRVLQAFCDRKGSKVVSKVDDCLTDAGILRIARAVLDEATVELQLREGQLAQARE